MRKTTLHALAAVVAAAALGLAAGTVQAQQLIRVDGAPASRPAAGPKVYTLTVSPAAQPEPALRYLLLPGMIDTTPGNAAVLYQMAKELLPSSQESNVADRIAEWVAVPADKLPWKEVEEALRAYGTAVHHVELAARREKCDLDLPFRSEGMNLLMPSLSKYRQLARVVALRARLSVADGRFDDAIHDLQTGYAMARHSAESVTLIESLVGISVADLMNQAMLELMQSKGAPNLYWALASLPRPFVSLRKPLEYDRDWIFLGGPGSVLRKAAYGQVLAPHEAAVVQAEFTKMWDMVFEASGWQGAGEGLMRARLPMTIAAIRVYPLAKKHLAQKGYTAEQIERMPVAQAIAVFSLGRYLHARDEVFKWLNLPWPVAGQGIAKATDAFLEAARKPEEGWPFTLLVPGLGKVGFLEARLDRRLGAMMAIEAIRLYAAAHGGKAPATLDELTDSPVLPDPVTGKPFQYERTDDGFVITYPAPTGSRPEDGAVYKVTLRK